MARRAQSPPGARNGEVLPNGNAGAPSTSRATTRNGRAREPPPAGDDVDEGDREAEGSSDDGDGDDGEGSPKGRKRARINLLSDSRPTVNGRSKGKGKASAAPPAFLRHPDGYVPGSITRVRLHNFVTYDDVEFYPGPHLNMIIGPNGTGKSSIACAIALGLNWSPSILGRANELNLFVKNTQEEGFIEIELKGVIGKPNVIIKRTLSRKSKASTFYVNGRASAGRDVTQTMNELNVQVGNLCSFLPQDRVSEFAQMSPQQLLRETQRAAGDARLTGWHDTLINAGREKKELAEMLENDRKQLETLRERNENLEREVQRFRERKDIERRISVLEVVIPFLDYYEIRDRYREARVKQRELHAKVAALKRKNQPLEDLKARLENKNRRLSTQREQKKHLLKKYNADLHKRVEDNEKLTSTAEDAHNQLDNLKKSEKSRVKRIHDLEKSIGQLETELSTPPQTESLESITEESRALNTTTATLSQKRIDLSDRQSRNIDRGSKWRMDVAEGNKTLQGLDNVAHQKLEHLRRSDPDVHATVLWLRQNQALFREEILEPPIVTLTVPNRAYLDAIEGCFASHQLRTFVAQNDDDYRLFNRYVVDTTEAIGRRGRISTSLNKIANSQAPLPMTNEQLREMGFDGWALDFVSCPPLLHTFLKQSVHLHRTAIGISNPSRINPDRAMQIVSRGGGGSYVIGRTMNTVMKSQYGRRLPQNVTREIKAARFLVGPTIPPQYKLDVERNISEAQAQLTAVDSEAAQLADEDRALKEQEREHRKAHASLADRRKKVMDVQSRFTRLQSRYNTEQAKLAELKAQLPPDAERQRLNDFLVQISKRRVVIAEKSLDTVRLLHKAQIEQTALQLETIQLCSNLTALDTLIQERNAAYQETLDLYQAASQLYNDLKHECAEKKKEGETQMDDVDDDVRQDVQDMNLEEYYKQHSADDVRNDLAEQQQKLELVMEANPGAVEQYERRKTEIEALSKKVEERDSKIDKLQQSIQRAQDHWLPTLKELVISIGDKFSAAFDRIGCAGQVELTEHEDYDKWAITIWVKFRDDAQLQQLTPHRQSGGERSLTTIMYLMSMTEHARSPFSLVDEINQGMDQRAERVIHNQLVQTTCDTECGQYFLITPKLLPDLEYHERMKVLCINNGEWLPADEALGGSMMTMIKAYIQHPSRNGSSVSSVGP